MNSPAENPLDRILVLEMVRVTEAAAVAASKLIGRGDEKAADAAAVEAMRKAFDTLYMDGTVVIGEGERDEAPMLFIGEKVGGAPGKGPKIDIALDPLEGTTITANMAPTPWPCLQRLRKVACSMRPTFIWTSWRLDPAIPTGSSILPRPRPRTCRQWPKPKALHRRTSSSACSIARATPTSSPNCAAWVAAWC